MKDEILISVIMSEYNTPENLLEESIQSILNQTYKNFEFIIVDDCGKNNVTDFVKKFNDDRIKVVKNPKNMGLVKSLNKALEVAKGKYIVRMDTDDFSYPERMQKQLKFIEEHPEYDLVSGRAKFYNGNEIFGETKFSGEVTKELIIKMGNTPIVHPSVIAKKDVLLKYGGYPDYKRCEDLALWTELALNGHKMYVMNEVLLRYHLSLNDYSKRSLKTRKGYFRYLKEKYKKLKPSVFRYVFIVFKNFVAGIMPYKIMAKFHKMKYKKGVNENDT